MPEPSRAATPGSGGVERNTVRRRRSVLTALQGTLSFSAAARHHQMPSTTGNRQQWSGTTDSDDGRAPPTTPIRGPSQKPVRGNASGAVRRQLQVAVPQPIPPVRAGSFDLPRNFTEGLESLETHHRLIEEPSRPSRVIRVSGRGRDGYQSAEAATVMPRCHASAAMRTQPDHLQLLGSSPRFRGGYLLQSNPKEAQMSSRLSGAAQSSKRSFSLQRCYSVLVDNEQQLVSFLGTRSPPQSLC